MYQRMLTYKNLLEREIENLKREINDAPPGKLICTQNGKYQKWYVKYRNSLEYLPKGKSELARALAGKECLDRALHILMKECFAVSSYLESSSFFENIIIDSLKQNIILCEINENDLSLCKSALKLLFFSDTEQNL